MKLEDYPKITIIMRGYSYEQAMLIMKVLSYHEHKVGVEVTTNNPDYLKIIKDGNEKYGQQVDIGVGTVLKANQAKDAIKAGAKFMLGPTQFNDDIFALAKEGSVITVPGAMTPSEVYDQFERGADIVKIFPAVTTGPSLFKQIQGPLGPRKLMAVGGINLQNAKDFIDNGADYLGIGSNFFNKEDVKNLNEKELNRSVEEFLSAVY
ncbi:2-dehydro-3-deoxy-phosphogluconate aldolase [Tetragenococcus halophilus subsp. flandriensis]|uniref:bifunctional 4-hydroxy-2-oxoglutarate aldolase/2-dehydro-3-deoxy-phosphogluconate aldolase n=1 Tax=Tetragenococcus halophilus TaxID=51669 RepID=UPI0023E98119|nr:bifunctional 4-hydroxy-2-oxoglutarate aldolase/2-dehydro-3-deoxy-phosphogluconate aldolase [Tetragenococcus halophilus]GMA09351.1 2-dehydro-3-deoxy-phosphogluconate aldolase [Tetragenococcus halophilus subsp. flandriensis]